MKTTHYSPSDLEVSILRAIASLQKEIGEKLENVTIVKLSPTPSENNPELKIILKDADGDLHEVIVRITQLPDK